MAKQAEILHRLMVMPDLIIAQNEHLYGTFKPMESRGFKKFVPGFRHKVVEFDHFKPVEFDGFKLHATIIDAIERSEMIG